MVKSGWTKGDEAEKIVNSGITADAEELLYWMTNTRKWSITYSSIVLYHLFKTMLITSRIMRPNYNPGFPPEVETLTKTLMEKFPQESAPGKD